MESSYTSSRNLCKFGIHISLLLVLFHWTYILALPPKVTPDIVKNKYWPNPVFVYNAAKKHNSTIIFLHDFGEHGTYWQTELESFRKPYIKVVCPQSKRLPVAWKGNKNISAWFNFDGKDRPRLEKMDDNMKEATQYIHKLIEDEIKSGIPPERIIISGVQQGAMLAINAALSFPKKLGAIVAFSPWHVLPVDFDKKIHGANKDIPVYLAQAEKNFYTRPEDQFFIKQQLKENFTSNIEAKLYEKTHNFGPEAFNDASIYCERIFGALPSDHDSHTDTIDDLGDGRIGTGSHYDEDEEEYDV